MTTSDEAIGQDPTPTETAEPQDYDDHAYDCDEDDGMEDDDGIDECGLMPDGQCTMAGSEHCDFCCPMRNSEFFCGSAAWNRKHARRERGP